MPVEPTDSAFPHSPSTGSHPMRLIPEPAAPLLEDGELDLPPELATLADQLRQDARRLARLQAPPASRWTGLNRVVRRVALIAAVALAAVAWSWAPQPPLRPGAAAVSRGARTLGAGDANSTQPGSTRLDSTRLDSTHPDVRPASQHLESLERLSGPELEGALDLLEEAPADSRLSI